MARTKKPQPQSAEDVELAKETITAAFADTVERLRAKLAEVQAEAVRLQQEIGSAKARQTAWVGYGTIDGDRALDAHMFSGQDMRDLARQVTSPSTRLDPAVVDAARRKHEVVERYLADCGLLPATLVDPNWRP